jgi:hypothetical protein
MRNFAAAPFYLLAIILAFAALLSHVCLSLPLKSMAKIAGALADWVSK